MIEVRDCNHRIVGRYTSERHAVRATHYMLARDAMLGRSTFYWTAPSDYQPQTPEWVRDELC